MAVIFRSESGFLVDHEIAISKSVSPLSLSCKDGLFALFEPYFRIACDDKRRKRKKSANIDLNEEAVETNLQNQKVKETIAKGMERLLNPGIGYFLSYPSHSEQVLPQDNTDFAELLKLSCLVQKELNELPTAVNISKENTFSGEDLFNRVISHPCDTPVVLNVFGGKFILPARCSFLMSDASNLEPLVQYAQNNGLYNMLVLDPPWFNKSARRSSKYSFMSLWQIKSLPVPQLLAPGALVGVWVTNKQKYLRFTEMELFPHWSVELVAEWYWVKVTRKGELVTNLDSPHKKPYEPLLIGRYRPQKEGIETSGLLLDRNMDKSISDSVAECITDLDESEKCRKRKINECQYSGKMMKRCHKDEMDCEIIGSQSQVEKRLPCSLAIITDTHADKREKEEGNLQYTMAQSERNQDRRQLDNGNSCSSKIPSDKHLNEYKGTKECCSGCCCKVAFNVKGSNSASESCGDITGQHLSDWICKPLPYHQVICSVPCRIHSRKPPLNEILANYLAPGSLCLEMFARNLTPNWTSWGNEVLKFQHMDYFDTEQTEDPCSTEVKDERARL